MGKQEMKRFPPPIDDFDEQTPDEAAMADQLAMVDSSPDATVDSMAMPEVDPPPAPPATAQKIGGADDETAVPPKAPETNSLLSEQLDNAIQDKLGERYAPATDVSAGPQPRMPRGEAPGSDDARFRQEADDTKIQDARKRDDWARILRGIELGGKQLIAGVLHQDKTAELVSPESTNYEGQARADAERGEQKRYARSRQEIAEAHQRGMLERQFRLDAAAAAERARTAGRQEKLDELKQRKDESDADFRERQLRSQEERARNHDATTREAARIAANKADDKGRKDTIKGMPAGWELTGETEPDDKQKRDFEGLTSSAAKMKGLTSKLRTLLSQTSGAERYLPGDKQSALKQVATQIMLEAKNVADLGAISGPDMNLIEAISADPTQLKNVFKDVSSLSNGLDEWAQNSVDAKAENIGARRKTAASAGPRKMQLPSGEIVEVE